MRKFKVLLEKELEFKNLLKNIKTTIDKKTKKKQTKLLEHKKFAYCIGEINNNRTTNDVANET